MIIYKPSGYFRALNLPAGFLSKGVGWWIQGKTKEPMGYLLASYLFFMEENILAFPREIYNPIDKNWVGLCLRFSHSRQKWIISYGFQKRQRNIANMGIGDTPSSAVDDFISKARNHA
jgi:hypothetical protein